VAKFRFAFLLERSQALREDAASAMQKAQAGWLAARSKLEQVESFRQEYRSRLTGSDKGITVTQWRDYQLFLGKLDTVARQQAEEVVRQEQAYQRCLAEWQECEKKVKAFEALQERHQQAELKRENRDEQKMLDEFNARIPASRHH
jgi:flagellar FliJ protein